MRSPDPETRAARPVDWIAALRAYLLATAFLDLLWEAAHLPLYTIWTDGTIRDKAFAVLRCTMGDVDRVRNYPIDARHALPACRACCNRRQPGCVFIGMEGLDRKDRRESNPPIGFGK